jgi:hypothetical protein
MSLCFATMSESNILLPMLLRDVAPNCYRAVRID